MQSTWNIVKSRFNICSSVLRISSLNMKRSLSATQSKAKAKPSYVHGSRSFELLGTTMGEMIDRTPDRFGDTEAVVDRFQGIRKTFTQFKKEVDEVAMGLLALNLKRGDLLGIWCPNRYEWMLAQMAAAKAGLIVTPFNPAYQKLEFEYLHQKFPLKALIIPETFKTQNYYQMITEIIPEIKDLKTGKIVSKKYPNFTDLIMLTDKDLPGVLRFKELYGAGGSNEKRRLEQLQNEIQMDDDLIILFTSGTTGKPKGATLSHFNVINDCNYFSDFLDYNKEKHRIACTLPLFHVAGSVGVTYAAMVSGVTCVFPGPSFDSLAVLQTIEEERCTSVPGVPTMYIDMLNHPKFKETDFSSVTTAVTGGSAASLELSQSIRQRFGASRVFNMYGATELSSVTTINNLQLAPVDSVGHAIPNTEMKIVDTNDNIVPVGVPGEICVRGFNVMKGYWNEPEKTKEVIINGWYHTGDIGILAEEGHLSVVGRIKDMIIRGGENIYPKEIEDLLLTHPQIAVAQVFGVVDERMGEEVCAWIQLKGNGNTSESEIKNFCHGKIAHFKIPKFIRFVTKFPLSSFGKIQKFVIKEEMENILSKKN